MGRKNFTCKQDHLISSLTADSWYGSLAWMKLQKEWPCTFSISSSHNSHLYELFTHGLKKGEYRVFENNGLFVCICYDTSIMTTATTACTLGKRYQDQYHHLRSTALQLLQIKPTLSEAGTQIIATMPLNDLQSLAAELGLAKGTLCE